MPKSIITKFEFSDLRLDNEAGFTRSHFDKLVKYNDNHGNIFFNVGYNKIRFKHYVGVIQVGDLTIEVLPKADNVPDSVEKWKKCLLTMLHECSHIKLESLDNAFLRLKTASLADLFIESFLNEVWQLLHEGLVKKYTSIENNVKYLKGRLIFSKDIQKNLLNKERFFTSHQVYNYNNTYNKITKAALKIISEAGPNHSLKQNAKNLLLSFDGIDSCKFDASDFEVLRYDRKTERYKYAINLARLIILEYSPDISSGNEDILSILFDMNKLFEEFVLVNLKREASRSENRNLKISSQEGRHFWNRQKVRPDIIVREEDKIKAILDTKWKILRDNKPSDEDLKQIYVYNVHFGSAKGLLVYPKVFMDTQDSFSYINSEFLREDKKHTCQLYFADLFQEDGRKKAFAKELLDAVLK